MLTCATLCALLAITSQQQAFAAVVTVTEYLSACKATYTSGTYTTTVTRTSSHTLHSSPTEGTTVAQSASASSTPPVRHSRSFVLEVATLPREGGDASVYLMTDGSTTTSANNAAEFRIEGGQLRSIDGYYISADLDAQQEVFSLSPEPLSISSSFELDQRILSWTNAAFDNGSAHFWLDPGQGEIKHDSVVVTFQQPVDTAGWTPVQLLARRLGEIPQTTFSTVTPPLEPTSLSEVSSPTRDATTSHTVSPSRPVTSSISTASGGRSPDGTCGGQDKYTCLGSILGDCCSQHGRCGTGREYCDVGCQPLFGVCLSGPSGTSSLPASSVPPFSIPPSSPAISVPTQQLSISFVTSVYSSIPTSIYSMIAQPIGPIRPISSPSSSPSFDSSMPTATATQSPVPACPTDAASVCTSPDSTTSCTSADGTPYDVNCGVTYQGTIIDTSNIVGLPPARKRALEGIESMLQRRATEASLGDCQTLCNDFAPCVALNYDHPHCELLSNVTSQTQTTGAVGCAVRPDYANAKVDAATLAPPQSSAPMPTPDATTEEGVNTAGPATEATITSDSPVMAGTTAVSGSSKAPSPSATTEMPVGPEPGSSAPVSQPPVTSSPAASSSLNPAHAEVPSQAPATSRDAQSKSPASTASPAGVSSQAQVIAHSSVIAHASKTPDTSSSASSPAADVPKSSAIAAVPTSSASPKAANVATSSPVAASSPVKSAVTTSSSPMTSSSPVNVNSGVPQGPSTSPTPVRSSTTTVAATPVAPSAKTTSSSTQSGLVLPSPTACSFDPSENNAGQTVVDDGYCEIDLPFPLQIYTKFGLKTYASSNGLLSLGYGTSQYSNQPFPASNLPDSTIAPFFDDLAVDTTVNAYDGIYYQVVGNAVTYEYFLTRSGTSDGTNANDTLHFTVSYNSLKAGVFVYTYYQTGVDLGLYAAVGMQGINVLQQNVGFTYSYQSASITPGLIVSCDTTQGTCKTLSK